MTTSKNTNQTEKDRQRASISADVEFFLKKPFNKITTYDSYGEVTKHTMTSQDGKNGTFA